MKGIIMRAAYYFAVAIIASLLIGCSASIPSESVELSKLVGEMIASAKISHVNMVNKHFDHLRSEVDFFAMNIYKDTLLSNVRKLSKQRDASFTDISIAQYDRLLMRVTNKRTEWIAEIETTRQQVLQALEEHYTVLLASNAEVTSLLRSAVKLSETRAAILERLGQKVGISGTKIKEVEDKLLEGTNSIRSIMDNALKQIGG
jgi:hypothetical protein